MESEQAATVNTRASDEDAASVAELAVAALLERIRHNPLECCVCATTLTAGTTAMLPCFHGFHKECLAKQAETHNGKPLRCGVCGTEVTKMTSAEDVAKLPSDVLVEAQLATRVQCSLCEEDGHDELDAVARCTTCGKALCELHVGFHKLKKFAGHAVEPLTVTASATPLCPAHPGETLKVYCVTCATVCCAQCVVSTHQRPEHQTVILASFVPELRERLSRVHADAARRSDELVTRLIGLRSTMTGVAARKAALEDEVRRSIKVLIQRLVMREEELLRDLESQIAQEQAALDAEMGEDQRRWLALHGALQAAQHLAAADSNADHVGRLAAPLEAHLSLAARDAVPSAPSATLFDFVVSEDLIRELSSVGRFVPRRAYGPECIADGPGTNKVFANKIGRFKLTAWTRSKERVKDGGDRVMARLVSAAGGSAIEATVTDSGDGTYAVAYAAPTAAGEYRLDVAVDGRAVRGSPFAVTVVATRKFTFTGPPYYDNKGVIYYIATAGGTRSWTNPHDAGAVVVSFSSKVVGNLGMFVANKLHAANEYCYTSNQANAWMSVSLNGKRVIPVGYVVSADASSRNNHFLRSWCLDGSLDGMTWTTLRTHTNDATLSQANLSGYWSLDGVRSAFSYFRIMQIYPNSAGTYELVASSFEIYGELFDL